MLLINMNNMLILALVLLAANVDCTRLRRQATQSNDSRLLFAGDFQEKPGLGINLGRIDYGMSQWVFTNKFKHARDWRTVGSMYNWENYTMEGAMATDWSSDGYPVNFTNLYWGVKRKGYQTEIGTDGKYPTGDYVITFTGTGNLSLLGDAQNVRQVSPNKFTFTVYNATSKGIVVIVTTANATNIDLRSKEDENSTSTFDKDFLNAINIYQALRFSAWMVARDGDDQFDGEWAKRRPATYFTQYGRRMVSIELIVELANVLQKDIWLSIPSTVNQEYVINLATFVYQNIGNGTKGWGANNRTAQMELIDTWKSVWGEDPRIKYVLSTFIGAYFEAIMSIYNETDLQKFHVFSIAGVIAYGAEYNYDDYNVSLSLNFTTTNITDKIRQEIYRDEIALVYLMQKVAIKLNIPLVGYDVGFLIHAPGYKNRWTNTSLAPIEQKLEDTIIDALRLPIIEDLYLDFMERWWKVGGDMMFISNIVDKVNRCDRVIRRCGYRGTLESLTSNPRATPKYNATFNWLNGIRGKLPVTSDDVPKPTVLNCSVKCVWGTCFMGRCECFDGYTGANCNQTTSKFLDCASNNTEFGTNIDGLSDWSTEVAFINLQRRARKWIVGKIVFGTKWADWDQEDIQLREDGYPKYLEIGKMIGTFLTRDLRARFPNGEYVCLYDGDGTLEFPFADVKITKREAGRIEMTISHKTEMNNGIYYNIIRTNPSNPIRNIRILEARYENHYLYQYYHPLFLSHMRKYQTIRFMQWSRINVDQIVDWSNRTTDSYYTFTLRSGVSIEHQVHLCNILGANPWFNIPHRATDEYIRQWATYIRDNLRPDVKIYIEQGNECWGLGGAHECGNYALKMGLLANMTIIKNQNYYSKELQARICYHAKMGKYYFDIIKQVFGDANRKRLKMVFGAQAAWSGPLEVFYLCDGNFSQSFDVVAIAPYWSASMKYPNNTLISIDTIFNKTVHEAISGAVTALRKTADVVNASAPNMELALYEAGPDFSSLNEPWNQALVSLSKAVHSDSRIYDNMIYYLNNMTKSDSIKLKVYMQFTSAGPWSQYGCWGLIQASDANLTEAYKYKAYMDIIDANNRCAWKEKTSTCLNNCSGNGVCTVTPFSNVKDTCYCYFGANGTYCDNSNRIKSDRCTYKCGGHGVCAYNHSEGNYDIFVCKCDPGYYGYGCTLFNCTNECNYNGLCVDNDTCSCYRGFTGKYCETNCGCNGRGLCALNKTNNATTCQCDRGYSLVSGKCTLNCSVDSNRTECLKCAYACANGYCIRGVCQCWQGYKYDSKKVCSVVTNATNYNSKIGVNLNGVVDWATQWAFVDLGKQARDWIVQHIEGLNDLYIWSLDEKITLNGDRYPAQVPIDRQIVTLMLRDVQQMWPSGIYHVFYDGDGLINFGFDAKIIENVDKGRMKIQVNLSLIRDNGIFMKIKKSNPKNPLRNIRIIMDGFEDIYSIMPFHPLFLERLSKFRTIRFMPWTYDKGNGNWSVRANTTTFGAALGVSYEYQLQLCNILKTNCWLTVPYFADNNFVTQLATLTKNTLRKDVKVYVEYTNEAWGNFFDGGKYCEMMGLKLNLSKDATEARNFYYARRSREIITIWKSVFTSSQDSRVVLVLGSFVLMPVISTRVMTFENASRSHSNVLLAITGYISCGSPAASFVAIANMSTLFDMCDADLVNVQKLLEQHVTVAKKFNVSIGMYESGSGMSELDAIINGRETPGATDKYIALNRDPRMYDVYMKYYRMYNSLNLTENNHYAYVERPSKYGSWSLIEYQTQNLTETHRYRAIMNLIDEFKIAKKV